MRVILFVLIALLLATVSPALAADEYAGTETCKGCHQDRYDSFIRSGHGVVADPRTPAAKLGCESCHGPGLSHASAGGGRGVGDVLPLSARSTLPAEKKSAPCLECHARGKVALWEGSTHQGRDLACSDCHSIHGGYEKYLAQRSQVDVCTRCHLQVKSQIQKSSHHPVREGKVKCSDCHNPHGTVSDYLISANTINEKCWECHTEKRGPFLWEHAPATEDCTTCHVPHGTSHDKLLVAKRPYLCQRCHSNSRHPGTLYALQSGEEGLSVYALANSRLFDSSCQNCHSQIHGSNHPSGKTLLR
ncbi:MAG: DmsE family decaheme c-type cytochrome [Nitrospirota bacterium]